MSSNNEHLVEPNHLSDQAFENPLQKIEKLLTCSICLDKYKQPKLLPCQHTFCLPCLDSYADTIHRSLKCPECRAEHALDSYQGVKSFPTNLTLLGFLDIHLKATEQTAAEFQEYIQTYNLERCKTCDEKAQLQLCSHCERKVCNDCRKIHIEMLKRDLARLLNQVKRLSNRIKDALTSLSKSFDSLVLNEKNTKAKISSYFYQFSQQIKYREEHLLNEVELFVQNELRTINTLRDVLNVENINIQDACDWVDELLSNKRQVTDIELCRIKNVFGQGVDYLRNFQPDSDSFFAKKLQFSSGNDVSKLPATLLNFGELSILVPQFSNRYLPFEEQYLAKPFFLGLESESYRVKSSNELSNFLTKTDKKNYSINMDENVNQTCKKTQQTNKDEKINTRSNLYSVETENLLKLSPSPWINSIVSSTNSTNPMQNKKSFTENKVEISPTEEINLSVAENLSEILPNSSTNNLDQLSSNANILTNDDNIIDETINQKNLNLKKKSKTKRLDSTTKKALVEKTKNSSFEEEPSTLNTDKIEVEKSLDKNILETFDKDTEVAKVNIALKNVPSSKFTSEKNKIEELHQSVTPNNNQNNLLKLETKLSAISPHQRQQKHSQKPPLPRQNCSQDEKTLNEKIEKIRANHEKINEEVAKIRLNYEQRLKERFNIPAAKKLKVDEISLKNDMETVKKNKKNDKNKIIDEKKEETKSEEKKQFTDKDLSVDKNINNNYKKKQNTLIIPSIFNNEKLEESKDSVKKAPQQKFKILYRSASSRPVSKIPIVNDKQNNEKKLLTPNNFTNDSTEKFTIPIKHFPNNSCECTSTENILTNEIKRSNTNPFLKNNLETSQNNSNLLDSVHQNQLDITMEQEKVKKKKNHQSKNVNSKNNKKLIQTNINNNEDVKNLYLDTNKDQNTTYRQSRLTHRSSLIPDRDLSTESCCSSITRYNENVLRRSSKTPTPTKSILDTQPFNEYLNKKRPSLIFGKRGSNMGEMNWPRGVCPMPGGEIAICDSVNHRVQIYNSKGSLIKSFGKYGTKKGELDSCTGIAYNRFCQQLVVADRYNHRIQIFDLNGAFVSEFGSKGSANGKFNNPWGVALDELGLIYVVDKDNHRVQVFDQKGKFMHSFGSMGKKLGEFNHPLFIAIHKITQNIYVSDSANHRICVFNHDCVPINVIGSEGFQLEELKLPRGIAVDDRGFVIIADSGNNRIHIFTPKGKTYCTFGSWGIAPGQLKGVEGIALMGCNIICADRENHRIQMF